MRTSAPESSRTRRCRCPPARGREPRCCRPGRTREPFRCSRLRRHQCERAGLELGSGAEVAAPFDGRVHEQERVAVGPPVSDSGSAPSSPTSRSVARSPVERFQMPGRSSPLPLVRERRAVRRRRPETSTSRRAPAALVEEVSDDQAVRGSTTTQRRMDQSRRAPACSVAEQRTVRSTARPAGSRRRRCPPSHTESAGAMELIRASAVEPIRGWRSRLDPEVAATTIPGACASPSFQPCGTPSSRNGRALASEERLPSHWLDSSPVFVLEPENAFAVSRARNRVDQPGLDGS